LGRALHFSAHDQSRPSLAPRLPRTPPPSPTRRARPRQTSAAAWTPCTGDGGPGRPVAPASLRVCLLPSCIVCLYCFLPLPLFAPQQQQQAERLSPPLRAAAAPAVVVLLHRTTIVRFVLCSAPLCLPPSRAHALATVCARGKAQSSVSSVTAPWPPLMTTRGQSPLRSLSLLSRAPASPSPRGAHACLVGRHHGLLCPAVMRQRRHARRRAQCRARLAMC
jgi:hypothetical protein